jgi:hypothetical protein
MRRFLLLAIAGMFFVSMFAGQPSYAGPQADAALSGKVVDTMNSGGYTYVQIEKKGVKTWVAVPEMKGVKKGQSMSFQPGTEMNNFESKTLKRTFDKIYFSAGPIK